MEDNIFNSSDLHYNFVFLFAHEDYWPAVIGTELYTGMHSRVYEQAFLAKSKLIQKLFHLHWAYSINCKIDLPFKRIWFRRMYKQSFSNGLPMCFVYLGGNSIRYDGGWCKYVRKQDPRNRQVIMHQDQIIRKINYDYGLIKHKVDFAFTLDRMEAQTFNIGYFPETVYTKLIPENESGEYDQDVYFLGAAKDRLPKIMAVFDFLTKNGLKCKFQIAGVPKSKQVEREGIEYITYVFYLDNLKNVNRSRCLLELVPGESNYITTRACEAMAYHKKLITDCKPEDCPDELFNPGQLIRFNEAADIDINLVKEPYRPSDYPERIDMNPLRRLYYIQEQLEKLDHEKSADLGYYSGV